MKRYGYLYEKIYDKDNLLKAHHVARLGKGYYTDVIKVNSNEDYYINIIHDMLKNETYFVDSSKYRHMTIIDKGKERDIYKLAYYPHRIIQWAIILQIGKILQNSFIYDTYASIKGKGIHDAIKRIRKGLEDKEGTKYCLKIDMKKYYPNIDNHILYKKLEKKFKDKKLLSLLKQIIFSMGEKGQPIGSLWSQYAGNFYLSELDHLIKEKKGIKYYYRYCDDIVILHSSKEYLHQLRKEIQDYVRKELNLELKGNYQVFPTLVRGLDFLGYRFFDGYTLLRKKTLKGMKRKINKIKNKPILSFSDTCSLNSYAGWLKPCNSYYLKLKYLTPLIGKEHYQYDGTKGRLWQCTKLTKKIVPSTFIIPKELLPL